MRHARSTAPESDSGNRGAEVAAEGAEAGAAVAVAGRGFMDSMISERRGEVVSAEARFPLYYEPNSARLHYCGEVAERLKAAVC